MSDFTARKLRLQILTDWRRKVSSWTTITFYRFAPLREALSWQEDIQSILVSLNLSGNSWRLAGALLTPLWVRDPGRSPAMTHLVYISVNLIVIQEVIRLTVTFFWIQNTAVAPVASAASRVRFHIALVVSTYDSCTSILQLQIKLSTTLAAFKTLQLFQVGSITLRWIKMESKPFLSPVHVEGSRGRRLTCNN